MSWLSPHRARICSACPRPCAERAAGTLDLAAPASSCPIGRWTAWQTPAPMPVAHPAPAPAAPQSAPVTAQAVRPAAMMETLGPPLWAELHGRPWTCDLAAEAAWLRDSFAPRLIGCACRRHWTEALTSTPADLTSPEAYFVWTVDRHNEVRARQGKPQLTLAAAYAEWHPARPLPASCTPHASAPQ